MAHGLALTSFTRPSLRHSVPCAQVQAVQQVALRSLAEHIGSIDHIWRYGKTSATIGLSSKVKVGTQ